MINKLSDLRASILQEMSITDAEKKDRLNLVARILNIFVPVLSLTVSLLGVLTGNWINVISAVLLVLVVSGIIHLLGRIGSYYGTFSAIYIGLFVIVAVIATNSVPPHVEVAYILIAPLLASIFLSTYLTAMMGVAAILLILLFALWMNGSMPYTMAFDLVGLVLVSTVFIIAASYRRRKFELARNRLVVQQERAKLMEFMLNSISHDFRTPLTIIQTNLYLLGRDPTPEKVQPRIEKMQYQTKRLEGMVNDILLLSRMEVSNVSWHTFDLAKLVFNCTEQLQVLAEKHHMTLTLIPIESTVEILGNANLWERVIINLLENALNYSDENGEVIVSLTHDKTCCVLRIKDNGIGIASDHVEHIFEPFYRVDDARQTETGGTGMGLAIVKRIVEDHHATITVESRIGEGTEFIISIPIKQVERNV